MIGFAGRRLSIWLLVLEASAELCLKKAAEARGRATAAKEQIVPALFQEPGDRDHSRGPETERKQTCESPRHEKLHRG